MLVSFFVLINFVQGVESVFDFVLFIVYEQRLSNSEVKFFKIILLLYVVKEMETDYDRLSKNIQGIFSFLKCEKSQKKKGKFILKKEKGRLSKVLLKFLEK